MLEKTGFFGWGAGTKTQTQTRVKPAKREKPAQLPPFNVVLINDDDHTYEYVIRMLRAVFGYTEERGYQLAREVDEKGRAIVVTTHKELAELKREQIIAHGADFRISTCQGSMSAFIEPA